VRIAVTGATGFIGRHTVKQLLADNHEVIAVVHHRPDPEYFDGSVAVREGEVESIESLTDAFDGVDCVVHLVGIIAETKTKTFESTVAQGTRHVVAACQKAGVKRIIYISAIGTSPEAPTKYHRTKAEAETAVKTSGLEFVILRSSLVYGPGDGFVSMLEKMIRLSPITPIPGSGRFKLQPVFVNDLTRVIACAAENTAVANDTLVVAGPDELEYLQILDLVKKTLKKKRLNFHIPIAVMKFLATIAEAVLSPAPITRDQLLMMSMGNVGDIGKMRKLCRVDPISMERGLSTYLR
jgi:NADH dehydrogenase